MTKLYAARTALIIALVVAGCSSQDAPTDESKPDSEKGKSALLKIKPLTAEEQEKLLTARLDGGMGYSFGQFGNPFFVSSRIQLGTGISLMTSDKEIAELPLQSPFPASYKPTLHEFLDAIALQTLSEWKYDPSSQYIKSEVELQEPVEGLASFEFTKAKRDKPFGVALADGWKAIDKGNWVMYVPPSFPVGMDIYEMGTYSSDEKTSQQDFANEIRSAVALQWAQRVNGNAKSEDLQSAKVGAFDALFYESMIPSQSNKEIKWRQWVFMVGNKCYFIVSTIFPEFEDKIFSDVQKMLASFRVKSK